MIPPVRDGRGATCRPRRTGVCVALLPGPLFFLSYVMLTNQKPGGSKLFAPGGIWRSALTFLAIVRFCIHPAYNHKKMKHQMKPGRLESRHHQQQDHHHRHRMHWALQQKRSRMVQRHRETPSGTPTPAAPPRPEHHQRARHIRSRGHQEVPLQRRRSTIRAPQTEHGVVQRNHCKSTQQTLSLIHI